MGYRESMSNLLLPGDHSIHKVRSANELLLPAGTSWVRRDHLRIREEIKRLWPNLDIAACRCNRCMERGHWPYMVVELCRDGVTRPIFGVDRLDGRVIKRLYEARNANNPLGKLQERNARRRAEIRARSDAERRERLDVVESALRSHKHNYRADSMGMRTRG